MFYRRKISYILIIFTFVGVGRCEGSRLTATDASNSLKGVGILAASSSVILVASLLVLFLVFAGLSFISPPIAAICAAIISALTGLLVSLCLSLGVSLAGVAVVGVVSVVGIGFISILLLLDQVFKMCSLANQAGDKGPNNKMANDALPKPMKNDPLITSVKNSLQEIFYTKNDLLTSLQLIFWMDKFEIDWTRRPNRNESNELSRFKSEVQLITTSNKKPNLWESQKDTTAVLNSLKTIYSVKQLLELSQDKLTAHQALWTKAYNDPSRYKQDETKEKQAHDELEKKLSTDPKFRSWTTFLKDFESLDLSKDLSWFTCDFIAMEAKRAIVRALLTKIRQSKPNTLTKSRYTQLTGKVQGSDGDWFGENSTWKEWWKNGGLNAKLNSYITYVQESFVNSIELENDIKPNHYLDQVITLFLLFVRDILGITVEVGQRMTGSKYSNSSSDYSTKDDETRTNFIHEVTTQLTRLKNEMQSQTDIIQTLTSKGVSFELTPTQAKIYYLAELADVFYAFISAEMDKTGLSDIQKNDEFIKRTELSNLSYLRKWFVRTKCVYEIIKWLFTNYKEHVNLKSHLYGGYLANCFMSDYVEYWGLTQISDQINKLPELLKTQGVNVDIPKEKVTTVINTLLTYLKTVPKTPN